MSNLTLNDYQRLTRTRELLYYPFVPLFTIFGNIISHPQLSSCGSAFLHLLRNAVQLLQHIDESHPHASKLHSIAGTFLHLAEKFLYEIVGKAPLPKSGNNTSPPDEILCISKPLADWQREIDGIVGHYIPIELAPNSNVLPVTNLPTWYQQIPQRWISQQFRMSAKLLNPMFRIPQPWVSSIIAILIS